MLSIRFIPRFAIIAIYAILVWLPVTLFAQADRISGQVDASHFLQVTGNVNPHVTPALDQGRVDPAMKLNYVHLMLKPSAAQQTALDQLLAEQQKPGSPNFRKWLTPEQYADRFGVSQVDIDKITGWMLSQGFDVITVARGRRFIAFNTTARQIQNALKTELHYYRVHDELHFANATAPSVPAAIQPLVMGFMGLDDFQPKAHSKPIPRGKGLKPSLYYDNQNVLGPYDLAVIYDVLPIYKAGYTGSGSTIAVIGRSNVQLSDIASFRSQVGLAANPPKVILVPGSTDPGIVSGDEGESDLDLEYSGAIAYDAQILFVYSPTILTSAMYAIDNAVAPVMSLSYGICEQDVNNATATGWQSLAQQANTEGVTWVNSAGDAGAAACDQGSDQASHGAAVELEPAIPEVTGVGGTSFVQNGVNYWDPTTTNAVSYIPETVWNETAITGHIGAGGGGYSTFYNRSPWQVGLGVPAGTARGVPDVSLAAAVQYVPYFVVENGGQNVLVGGTSAAAPTFAAMVLLLNQYLGVNGLGNINPSLYWMAKNTTGVFHDITTGWNGVPCETGSTDCNSTGYFGYYATPGWDPASGLGSVDATVMFNNWSVAPGNPQIANVLNGASFTNTGLSPGQFFTVFGSALGPVNGRGLELDENGNVSNYLAGITVFVNGTPAPLLYVGPTQINAIAPYELANYIGQTVELQVYDNLVPSGTFNVNVVAAAPAIFPLGNGQGAILNQDYTVNGSDHPAAPGSYIFIFGTGQGQTNPPGVDGQINGNSVASLPVPVGAFSLTIGGVPVPANDVAFAADAPYSVEGFFQVNVKIPENVKAGNQPVVLKIGGIAGPPANVVVK